MDKILVAVDGSEQSKRALEKAKEIGNLFNSELIIMHVSNTIRNLHPHVISNQLESEVENLLWIEGKKLLDEIDEESKDYEGKITAFIKSGEPGEEIIKKAKIENCDLVIIGSRGLNAFSRTMLGSVSNKVVNHLDGISVMVVK